MQYFWNPYQSSLRELGVDYTHGWSANKNLYKAYHNQVSSLPFFVTNGDAEIDHIYTKEKVMEFFIKLCFVTYASILKVGEKRNTYFLSSMRINACNKYPRRIIWKSVEIFYYLVILQNKCAAGLQYHIYYKRSMIT